MCSHKTISCTDTIVDNFPSLFSKMYIKRCHFYNKRYRYFNGESRIESKLSPIF